MTVATAAPDGRPSICTVPLKGVENGRFIFYTNYESHKGQQLADNPYIFLPFVRHKLERQIHVKGKTEERPPKDSGAHFSTHPYKSKIGAGISPQSRIINNRTETIRAFVKEATKSTEQKIQRLGNWGGFAVTPTCFEF